MKKNAKKQKQKNMKLGMTGKCKLLKQKWREKVKSRINKTSDEEKEPDKAERKKIEMKTKKKEQ